MHVTHPCLTKSIELKDMTSDHAGLRKSNVLQHGTVIAERTDNNHNTTKAILKGSMWKNTKMELQISDYISLSLFVGDDNFGRKVIVFNACRMPPQHQLDHHKLLM